MNIQSYHMSGGNMPLYKRNGSKHWQMIFFMNGRKVRMSTKTSNKRVAEKIYATKKIEISEGTFLLQRNLKMTFEELLYEVIENYSKVEKKSFKRDIVSGKSLNRYFKGMLIKNISPYLITKWRKWRTEQKTNKGTIISPASVNRELAFLKKMLNLAVEWDLIAKNPAKSIKKLKGEVKRLRYLKMDEVSRLIENSVDYLKPIIITAISTCMRSSEILNLKWKQIDFESGFIRLEKTKNSKPREIPIDDYMKNTLMEMKKSRRIGNYVFCNSEGKPRKSIKGSFATALKKSGIENFRFHDLRHTGASLLANGGCDIIALQEILGHQSLEMTQRYSHFMPEKHKVTRNIISNFWKQACDTKCDTVESFGGQ